MIELYNLCFSYGKNELFRNLNACFDKGELCCVVGANGSGKSTLLRLISGNLKPSHGNISVDGRSLISYSRSEYSRMLAFLPQQRDGISMTVGDIVSLGRFPYVGFAGGFKENDQAAVMSALERVNASELINRSLSELSGGERQRVYLAMIIAQNTPYVLLDEPTTFLDISNVYDIMDMLKALKKEGKCVLAVTHDIALALEYADKLLVVDKNSLSAELLTPSCAVENGTLERVFGISFLKTEVDGIVKYLTCRK